MKMKKGIVYGIIAAAVVVAAVSMVFAVMAFVNTPGTTAIDSPPEPDQVRAVEHAMGTTEITGTPQ
jgi:flagellar basal body-associated protein FliL